ncbi:MAG TPA: ATP-dependent zinc metalloprotease FtsH [Gaiellaceae bacterium]|jgi:cell division protease FtsH|nr:ATP-dependent zinc metalloprotease FtsH [Gaiellaceae bacterium]
MASRNATGRRPALRLPSRRARFIFYGVGISLLLIFNIWAANNALKHHRARVPYSPFFVQQIKAGNVESITSTGTAIQGRLRRAVEVESGGEKARDFTTEIPSFADTTQLDKLLESHDVSVNAEPLQRQAPLWERFLAGVVPTVLILLLLYWLFRRMTASGVGGLGRSRAARYEPSATSITFAEVAGIDEAKAELSEIVDFLKSPERYHRLGGRIPRGVLLSGAPGTGKTLLARAVAGEAGVPFFSLSASEFIEAVVGIGASRVRDLFKKAKEAAPAIVFIDELDAIGRARSSTGFGAGSEEREQTLNQILTEMDGFTPATDVIVIAATNRPDVLDKALLRPGRFDRRIAVSLPDRSGRRLILEVHSREVPLASDVDLAEIASRTPGMAGADLANLVNEAALTAARRGVNEVSFDDFMSALERILLGAERKLMMTEDDRRRTAYHEGGHALAGMLIPGADPVRKVTIIPRGAALGVTLSSPDTDRFNYTDRELSAKVRVLLAGRAAEQMVYGELTSGAESDLEQLTVIARYMVGRWGMSESVGMMAALDADNHGTASPETLALLDDEVRKIADEAYADIVALLRDERDRLDALAEALLVHETLDAEDAYAAVGMIRPVVEEPRPPLTVQDAG